MSGFKDLNHKKILIIKPSALGDIIHAIPCATALKDRFPHVHISWIVKKEFVAVLQGLPEVDEVIPWDYSVWKKGSLVQKIKYMLELRTMLSAKHFDIVLDLQGLFKSALLAIFTGCSVRYGCSDMREGSAWVSKRIVGEHSEDNVVQRYLDTIRYLGVDVATPRFALPISEVEREWFRCIREENSLEHWVAVIPGASIPTKEWLIERYTELVERIVRSGQQVVLLGGKNEVGKAEYILAHLPMQYKNKVVDLVGKTSLKELMAVLEQTSITISGDTGPMHIAVAVGSRVLGLFGRAGAERTGPYGNIDTCIWKPPSCAPCRKKVCEDMFCMKAIGVDEVYNMYLKMHDTI